MDGAAPTKDRRIIARKYQLELCKKAVAENIIVYLATGCGKTHIAVLLMLELAHLFRKPKRDVCVFLAPTVPLVRQQALVIENSTDFKVQSYFGNCRHLKTHDNWENEFQQYEILVMTPQILLQNLRHCFITMDLIALLIFDECHHAQLQKRHPYAQIMKEFYGVNTSQRPRIFGMTASPIIGKGGCKQLDYAKSINSLEHLLNAKVCVVDDDTELESVVASPDMKVYAYNRFSMGDAKIISHYVTELEKLKDRIITSAVGEKPMDLKVHKRRMKVLWRVHDNLIFCLANIGLCAAIEAARILLACDGSDLVETEFAPNANDKLIVDYLKESHSILHHMSFDDIPVSHELPFDALEEPFFSRRLLVLIEILHKYKERPNIRCIVFVKRIIVAKSLTYIIRNLECLDFWQCDFLVGFHSGSLSRTLMNKIVERFSSGEVNLLIATNVAEEGLDIQTCCLVIRFDLPETVASYIQSRGRARMSKSEYAFIIERGNKREEKLLEEFIWSEEVMNKEIIHRTSDELPECVEETTYRVDSTGASISTGCSVSLLHHYCSKLSHDEYFNPMPKFFYIDDLQGTICRVLLPPNSPIRQVDSEPMSSKDEAKRSACLKACVELHRRGALSDFLLPDPGVGMKTSLGGSNSQSRQIGDENLGEELYETIMPTTFALPWSKQNDSLCFYFYYIEFVPVPDDRIYRKFGLFVEFPLPKEAENMEVDLHLAHGRIVKTRLSPSGIMKFNREEIIFAEYFQEMSFRIILDRSEFCTEFVSLGTCQSSFLSPTFYLLLPVIDHTCGAHMIIDWCTIKACLSSPVFSQMGIGNRLSRNTTDNLELVNGSFCRRDIVNSLVYVPITGVFYFIDGFLEDVTGYSKMKSSEKNTKSSEKLSYCEYYKRKFNVNILRPDQHLLKAKQLFCVRNLLCNRLQDNTEARELVEHFVELPPEICQLKIIGFSKDIGSSLSLLPSLMHRLQNLLVAVELKSLFSSFFPEGSEISAYHVLEALTTEKCLERFSLERLEILGDAFLKYAVGRHTFLTYDALDEGQLTNMRSTNVNNLNLYQLAIRKKLQVYIRDEKFEPTNFFALGRPCKVICNQDAESSLHPSQVQSGTLEESKTKYAVCNKNHRWLQRKTIADAVEALVGVFLVDSGFKGAIAFLNWLGIDCHYRTAYIQRAFEDSRSNMSLNNIIDIDFLEKKLGYIFRHKGLLIQAFIHPSYTKHSGGCYQRLEFLGDAVLEYLITSYVFSAYPELKPGQLSDLRSITVCNSSFARTSVQQSFHRYIIKDSKSLSKAINKFESYVQMPDSQKELTEEPAIPKVLGDVVESCIGAVLLDSGFNMNCAWQVMVTLLDSVLKFSGFHMSPIRELMELCQSYEFELYYHQPIKDKGMYMVKVDTNLKDQILSCSSFNCNSKTAKKLASREMISKLKALGFKHKSKTLEELLLVTRKEKPELIGFNEPILVEDDVDTIQLDKLKIEDMLDVCMHKTATVNSIEFHKTSDSSQPVPKVTPEPMKDGPFGSKKCVHGKVSAKSKLFEMCESNYWNPPSFVCCNEEGLSHLKKFTYKVTVEVGLGGSPNAILECFSEPRQKKKDAQEHAAEGAIWYLNHQGYA